MSTSKEEKTGVAQQNGSAVLGGLRKSAFNDVERSAAAMQAGQQFINSSLNMGWQMALTVLIPVFIGVKLDSHFHTQPSYTLAALFLAVAGAAVIVSNTIKSVRRDQENKK